MTKNDPDLCQKKLNNLKILCKGSDRFPSGDHLLLMDKPVKKTSFDLVAHLRRATGVQKIGHAGTLDPFATGVMVLLIGKSYTRLSSQLIEHDKEYLATLHLGIATDSYDCEGKILREEKRVPSLEEIEALLPSFQGTIWQTPPMFSAKKVGGKKLYELARKGIEIERNRVQVTLSTELISYTYPELTLRVSCSKGTYIRSIAHEIGELLGVGAHLSSLVRTRSGPFLLADCFSLDEALSLYGNSCISHTA